VNRYEIRSENPHLLEMAIEKNNEDIGRDAAGLLLSLGGEPLAWKVLRGKDTARIFALLEALGGVGSKKSIDMVQAVALSPAYAMYIRKRAAGKIGRSWGGEERVLEILKQKKVPKELIPDVVSGVSQAWRGAVRTEAESYLAGNSSVAQRHMPTMDELQGLQADPVKGKTVFMNSCALCHQVNNEGYDFGPKLGEIGSKLPEEGLMDALLHPSSGISFGYEGWEIDMKDGSMLSGIISSKTETEIDLKLPAGIRKQIKTIDIRSMKKMKTSLMPEGLYKNMSDQDLANLLKYLSGLVKK
jgi:putative heme-binding domain-containing protein